MLRLAFLGCALLLIAGHAVANEEQTAQREPNSAAPAADVTRPSNDEVRKVMDFYNRGRELLLTEHKLCKEIGKAGEAKNDCVNEVAATELMKGEKTYLWMAFMVPKEFKEGNLLIQFNQNGVTKSAHTREIKMNGGSMRYRVFEMVPTLNPGDYEAVLMLDTNGQTTPLEKFAFTVKPKG